MRSFILYFCEYLNDLRILHVASPFAYFAYRNWAKLNNFSEAHIINDGSKSNAERYSHAVSVIIMVISICVYFYIICFNIYIMVIFLLCRLGAIADLQLALQKGAGSGSSADVIVVAGDTLFLEVINKPPLDRGQGGKHFFIRETQRVCFAAVLL